MIAFEDTKRMTWDEIVKEYPNHWVAMTDCDMDGINIDIATLLGVCDNNDERAVLEHQLVENKVRFIWKKTKEYTGNYFFL